jgi:hypothetical protein
MLEIWTMETTVLRLSSHGIFLKDVNKGMRQIKESMIWVQGKITLAV